MEFSSKPTCSHGQGGFSRKLKSQVNPQPELVKVWDVKIPLFCGFFILVNLRLSFGEGPEQHRLFLLSLPGYLHHSSALICVSDTISVNLHNKTCL